MSCPQCDSIEVWVRQETEEFKYGDARKPLTQVTLSVAIPVWTCRTCGFEWTDYVAEELIDKKVRDYLHEKLDGEK